MVDETKKWPREIALGERVVRQDFETAEHFLEALRPMSGLWYETPPHWLFRGHSDAAWDLLPSAHRRESWKPLARDGLPFDPVTASEDERQNEESAIVCAFVDGANEIGLSLPGDPEVCKRTTSSWPPKEAVPLVALAQHYGVPTRLLDWSRHAPVAAYFAAAYEDDQKGDKKEPDTLAVWALDGAYLKGAAHERVNEGDVVCRLETAPRSSNRFLHAQAGMFTYCPFLKELVSIDKVVGGMRRWHYPERCLLRMLTLPRTAARQLMTLLHFDGISALTMFPAFSGIAAFLHEHARFRIPLKEF